MRAVIADGPFNRRFLRIAVAACGIDEIPEAGSLEELLAAAEGGADLVLLDPRLDGAWSSDVVEALLALVPACRLVIVSGRNNDLTQAAEAGLVVARKRSILFLDELESAIRLALSRDIHVPVINLSATGAADVTPSVAKDHGRRGLFGPVDGGLAADVDEDALDRASGEEAPAELGADVSRGCEPVVWATTRL